MPWELFDRLLELALKVLADEQKHPGSFYKSYRLIGIDGTEFSVSNTPQILGRLTKAASRRFEAAFANIGVCVMVELGLHNPIAAAIGKRDNCELALAKTLWDQIPEKSLLLADRLFGTQRTLYQIQEKLKENGGEFLVRVRKHLAVEILELLPDKSALIEVKVRNQEKNRKIDATIRLREIRGRIQKPGSSTWTQIRLWTSLLDATSYPAQELLKLYAQRWEQELYYKELKLYLGGSHLLQSHTLETAAQEIASLVLASAMVARERLKLADKQQVAPIRVSFSKILDDTRSLWKVLALSQGILSVAQQKALVEANLDQMSREVILPARRSRSSPRKVRKTVSKWPRLCENHSHEGLYKHELLDISLN